MGLWFTRKQPEEHWLVVKVLEGKWVNNDKPLLSTFYYLSESNYGHRKLEYKGSLSDWDKHTIYLGTAYPWLAGGNFADIPTYWDEAKQQQAKYIKCFYNFVMRFRGKKE